MWWKIRFRTKNHYFRIFLMIEPCITQRVRPPRLFAEMIDKLRDARCAIRFERVRGARFEVRGAIWMVRGPSRVPCTSGQSTPVRRPEYSVRRVRYSGRRVRVLWMPGQSTLDAAAEYTGSWVAVLWTPGQSPLPDRRVQFLNSGSRILLTRGRRSLDDGS